MPHDPFELLQDAAKSAQPGYRNSKQMHEDFNDLFFSTPRGQRVFHQIMEWAGTLRTSFMKGDPYGTHFREGERNLGARIWAACIEPPIDKPTRTRRK